MGWKYRDDWLRLSKWEQVHWIAFREARREIDEELMAEAEEEAKRKEGAVGRIPGR